MKCFLSIISLLLLQYSFACECIAKPKIDILDINNSDIVATAILSDIKYDENKTHLTFLLSKIYKGQASSKFIFYSVAKDKEHNAVFHHISTIFKGQKWIVFSSNSTINGKEVLQLSASTNHKYCMLSKPTTQKDPYLSYINTIIKTANNTHNTFYQNKTLIAKGRLKNMQPIGVWKYYSNTSLNHYWEGNYTNGKRDGVWKENTINFKNQNVIINKETYQNGNLKNRTNYNYVGEKQSYDTFEKTTNTRIKYYKTKISAILTYNKIEDCTTIEKFKNGKSISITTQNQNLF